MALQSSTFVNGQWTTTSFGVDHILRVHNQKDKIPNIMDVEKAPTLGLLSQTVIRSPLVHWILPVRLRGSGIDDVAFIGDDFVQIRELRPDGLLWDVTRKENFGSRIRNACAIGSVDAYNTDPDVMNGNTQVKEEDDVDMLSSNSLPETSEPVEGVLPPQYLLLQLQTGDSVFLMLRQSAKGQLELVSSRYGVLKATLSLQPGMHLAVDPSSRYMAIGCSEGVFAIYALHSRDELKAQFSQGLSLRYVEAETYIYFTGVIIKMEFLYPTRGDEGHIILLALVVIKGKTRMLIWEWDTGTELKNIRARSLKGHLVQERYRLPQLLIPLKTKSSFILVCENSMSICKDLLHGSPNFVDFNNRIDPPTTFYNGSAIPLWTAWARPTRLPERIKKADDIFIVREDGITKFLEVDPDAEVTLDHNIGELGANCGRALACLDYWNKSNKLSHMSGDLFVTGGDSCAGGTYLIQARRNPEFIEPIQNWAPSQDFVTTYEGQDRDIRDDLSKAGDFSRIPLPDRIFSCGGKGMKGAITEFRYGLEASIGLKMDYDISITDVWVLYPDSSVPEDYGASFFLMSIGDRSAALRLSADAIDVHELEEESTDFDLNFRTIAAAMQDDTIIQVTEKSIVIISSSILLKFQANDLLDIHSGGVCLGSGTSIFNAAIGGKVIVFTTYFENSVWLQLVDYENAASSMQEGDNSTSASQTSASTISQFSPNVTSIAIGTINSTLCAIVAEQNEDSLSLTFVPVRGGEGKVVSITPMYEGKKIQLGGIVSIAMSPDVLGHILLLCGTRNGVLITLEINKTTLEIVTCKYYRVGATPAVVTIDEFTDNLFFVRCDSKLYTVTPKMSVVLDGAPRHWLHQVKIHQVWLCDNARPEYFPPKISSTARMRPNLSGSIGGSMLFVAGSQLLIARLCMQPKPVPRHLVIRCTPTRLMYSSTLQVLVVAASLNGKSTLLFIDPDTGYDLSEPIDHHTKVPISFVSGLGNSNERVFRLFEWTLDKGKSRWYYIVVATSSGRVLVINIENLDRFREEMQKARHHEQEGNMGKSIERSKIRFFLKHKFRGKSAATAVIGYPDGIIWSHGNLLLCEALSLTERKFETVGRYELPSPAINLSYENGKIYVLTSLHSLEILEMVSRPHGYQITRTHGDPVGRAALHHTIVDRSTAHPIHLVSDKMCSLVGMWPTQNTKADTLEPVFEAQLPYSILRFRFGKCRPIWDPVWTSAGSGTQSPTNQVLSLENSPMLMNRSETLGLSISGSLSHYTILDVVVWEFLRFLIDLALRSPKVCEFTYKDSPMPLTGPVKEPKIMMHIDGDILRHCLELRILEDLLQLDVHGEETGILFGRFVELLQGVHLGTLPVEAPPTVYMEQAYADLDFLLRPVL